jgi:hypothetical protein
MRTTRATAWVVYQAAVKGMEHGPNAVCDQAEWDAMEAAAPGIKRLARGSSGDFVPRGTAKAVAA